jgi:hypothetical protein
MASDGTRATNLATTVDLKFLTSASHPPSTLHFQNNLDLATHYNTSHLQVLQSHEYTTNANICTAQLMGVLYYTSKYDNTQQSLESYVM